MFEDRTTYAPLVLFEYDHRPGDYCLMLSGEDLHKTEATFTAAGWEGGGYSWAGIAKHLLTLEVADGANTVSLDPEAGMMVAYGRNLLALQALGAKLHAAFHEPARLAELLATAPNDFD